MLRTFYENRKFSFVKKALCLLLSLALIFGAFVFAPPVIEADAASNLKFRNGYTIRITLTVTDDADGWNSACCKIYTRPKNGTGSEHVFKEYDIKSYIDHSGGTWEVTENLDTEFPSDVLIYTDFGGGFTWREWAADVTVYVNDINVRSSHVVSSSSCFDSSDEYDYLTIDKIHYPYPKTINVLNHHSEIEGLPDEENFNDFYQAEGSKMASGKVFINACDAYGVTWYGSPGKGGQANSVTNDSGDKDLYNGSFSTENVSEGTLYTLYSTSGQDHSATYTFTYNTGNDSHAKVTKQVKAYFYFRHKLTVKSNNQVIYTKTGFKGQVADLEEVPLPAGYTLTSYDQTGLGTLDYIDDDDSYQFIFDEGDATLTANIKANKYKIHFDGNGSTSGSMSNRTYTYDSPTMLPACDFRRTGFDFVGWNTEPDGTGTAIANKGFAINLTTVNNDIVTLYAQWDEIVSTITVIYPDEMGIDNQTIKIPIGGSYEPYPFYDTGDSNVHWVYDGVEEGVELTNIVHDMSFHVYYHAEEHTFGNPETVVSPSCGVTGTSQITCAGCGHTITSQLDALTHDYTGPVWTWEDDYSAAQAKFTCLNCGDVQTIDASITVTDSEDIRTHTATAQYDGETYTSTQTQQIYTISFDLNGGYGSLNPVVMTEGMYELPGLHVSAHKQYANFTGWKIGDKIYQPGENVEAGNFTAVAQWEIPWSNIQGAIDNSTNISITLTEDLIAASSDGPLTIPSGKTVTINLNGHTIDRNLSSPAADGSVIKVTGGTLSITDNAGGGRITGGNTTGNGGGIDTESGIVNISSGEISYNIASGNGGGIYLSGNASGGAVKMWGGTVCENICGGKGSGIYAAGASNAFDMNYDSVVTHNVCTGSSGSEGGVYADNVPFKINKQIKIYDNYKADGSRSNTVISGETPINVWFPLESQALVYISGEPGRVYVHDTNVDDDPSFTPDISNYVSDNYDYEIALNSDKDIIFVNHTHTYETEWVWSGDTAQYRVECTECGYVSLTDAQTTYTDNDHTRTVTASVEFGGENYSDQKDFHINFITFDTDGIGSMESVTAYDGDYILPVPDASVYSYCADFAGLMIDGNVYQPGEVIEAADLTAKVCWSGSWAKLQAALNNTEITEAIVLPADITATADDGPLTVPSGRSVTIDLNGFTLDRALTAPQAHGGVIESKANTLIIKDSAGSGKITGGNTTGNGGGILVEDGVVQLMGGELSGNNALGSGGGVYICAETNGTFTMFGENEDIPCTAVISGNTCSGNGSGICAEGEDSQLIIGMGGVITGNTCTGANGSGGVYADSVVFYGFRSVKVYGNTKADGTRSNIVMNNTVLKVFDDKQSEQLIYITGDTSSVYAASLLSTSPLVLENFRSDSSLYEPALGEDGKLIFVDHPEHTPDEFVAWHWSADCTSAQAEFTCTKCEDTVLIDASVTETGRTDTHITYTAALTVNSQDYTDTAQKAIGWNLFVAGVQVNGDNYTDILGNGTAAYDYENNELTLSGAVIEMGRRSDGRDVNIEYGIRCNVNASTPLKVLLIGTNRIVNNVDEDGTTNLYGIAAFNGDGGRYNCSPTFYGDGSLSIEFSGEGKSLAEGLHITGAVTTVDNTALTVSVTGTSSPKAVNLSNNKFALVNAANVTLTAGSGEGATGLYANNLSVSPDSVLSITTGSAALSDTCVIDDNTKAHEILAYNDTETVWNGTDPLSGFANVDFAPEQITVVANNLSLNGDIALNFYAVITNVTEDAYAEFTIDGKTFTSPVNLSKTVTADDAGRVAYKFTCNVNAAQIDMPVTGAIYQGERKSDDFSYSVHEYLTGAKTMAEETQEEQYVRFMPLASAIATYGYYANELFGYDENFVPHVLMNPDLLDEISFDSEVIADAQPDFFDEQDGVKTVGMTLMLLSTTSLRVYFSLRSGQSLDDFTFTTYIGDDEVTLNPVKKGKNYYVEIPGIKSDCLADSYYIAVTNGEGEEVNSWTLSALSYSYQVLELSEAGDEYATDELVNTAKALAVYYLEADEYFNG